VEEYISKHKRFDQNDFVNAEVFNAAVETLQHNIDLLFNQWKSSHVTWNVSELLFGNLLDFDSTGQKRFVNGGKMDVIEKILLFKPFVGSIRLEKKNILNNNRWLTWDIPRYLTSNVKLSRSIALPETIRHQNLLIAFKFATYQNNTVLQNERFEVYVNGVHSGSFNSGTVEINGIVEAKTGFAVYSLTGNESNILIELVRSPTNTEVPNNYSVKISNIFCGLHTLGNSAYKMNFPGCGSSFVGKNADIEAFYDFQNNAVRPIPTFLIGNEHMEGDSSLTINVTETPLTAQTTFYVGLNGSGNNTGINSENRISFADFFALEDFSSRTITVDFEYAEGYGDMIFTSGNFDVYLHGNTKCNKIKCIKNSYVTIQTSGDSDLIDVGDIVVQDHSNLVLKNGTGDGTLRIDADSFLVEDFGDVYILCGTFGMDLNTSKECEISNNSTVLIELNNSAIVNADGRNGYGFSVTPINAKKFSTFQVINNNTNNLVALITRSSVRDIAIQARRHSHVSFSSGFSILATLADTPNIQAEIHSSIELQSDIQSDGGTTSFEEIVLSAYSTLGGTGSHTSLIQTVSNSLVYTL
jgi:hypothetical protein